ncbi:MAG TPA: hypothetical protein PK336_06810, partial [Methanoculleus sp.]|nr:hypothetical protein [Methanoculleus sp.]
GDAVPAGRVFWRRKSTRLMMREQPDGAVYRSSIPPPSACMKGVGVNGGAKFLIADGIKVPVRQPFM